MPWRLRGAPPSLADAGRPGSLGPFLTWMVAARGVRVAMPRGARPDRGAADKRLAAETSRLLVALEAEPRPVAARALLAACLSRAFSVPLERVLSFCGFCY